MAFKFSGAYVALESKEHLQYEIKEALADFVDVDKEHVEITETREGPVIVFVVIYLPSSRSNQELLQLTNSIMQEPEKVFMDEFIEEFGIPTVHHPGKCLNLHSLLLFALFWVLI